MFGGLRSRERSAEILRIICQHSEFLFKFLRIAVHGQKFEGNGFLRDHRDEEESDGSADIDAAGFAYAFSIALELWR